MTSFHLDMFQTMALGILALFFGLYLNRKIEFFRKFCIPVPVSGGLLVSLVTLCMYSFGGIELSFDPTLKDFCMLLFFTTVGFQCDFNLLKKGGKPLLVMVVLVGVLLILQNLLSVGISSGFGLDPLLGLSTGSVTMCGGHGTAGGFCELFEEKGLQGAASIMMSAATFGLISGSLVGGPLANRLITKYRLDCAAPAESSSVTGDMPAPSHHDHETNRLIGSLVLLSTALVGLLLSKIICQTGISVPTYFGGLITAIAVRNISEAVPVCPKINMTENSVTGNTFLSLFLGMAMVSLKLWELAGIALPLLVMLCAQTVLIFLFARFIAFPSFGKNYDAALMVSGLCGFGLGATPNALANMRAVCRKYQFSTIPFIIVPVVGSAFLDIMNITVITLFLNIFK